MVQVRLTAPPCEPARNQTFPVWPAVQFAPVWSSRGFVGTGCASTHCHHATAHPLNDFPCALDCGGATFVAEAAGAAGTLTASATQQATATAKAFRTWDLEDAIRCSFQSVT